jgi:membrane fusion protein, copper/silver efflux system
MKPINRPVCGFTNWRWAGLAHSFDPATAGRGCDPFRNAWLRHHPLAILVLAGISAWIKPSDVKAANEPNEFSVPVERQQQIGVTYTTAELRRIQFSIRSIGTLEPDQTRIFEYVARVDGYLQELKVTSPGERVTKDQPLLTLYSPDIRSTEQELVNLLTARDKIGSARSDTGRLIASAEERLRLWNISQTDIDSLEASRSASTNLVLRSPFAGVITQVPMKSGANVKTGDLLVGVIDLSHLWLWAQFYENEAGLLQAGQTATISLTAFPDKPLVGKISAIDPRVDAVTRTTRVRIDLDNPEGDLRPGMFASVELKIDCGEGLTVPVDAVLPTGSRGLVFVDKGGGKLEPRFVQVVREFNASDDPKQERYYQIKGGLKEGERVVSSANFLIDAESQIQGALKNFEPPEQTSSPR